MSATPRASRSPIRSAGPSAWRRRFAVGGVAALLAASGVAGASWYAARQIAPDQSASWSAVSAPSPSQSPRRGAPEAATYEPARAALPALSVTPATRAETEKQAEPEAPRWVANAGSGADVVEVVVGDGPPTANEDSAGAPSSAVSNSGEQTAAPGPAAGASSADASATPPIWHAGGGRILASADAAADPPRAERSVGRSSRARPASVPTGTTRSRFAPSRPTAPPSAATAPTPAPAPSEAPSAAANTEPAAPIVEEPSADAVPVPSKPFVTWNGTLYRETPASILEREDFPRIHIVYTAHIWQVEGQDRTFAPEDRIRELARSIPPGTTVCFDIEHWHMDPSDPVQAQQELDQFLSILRWTREENPDLKLGFYGKPTWVDPHVAQMPPSHPRWEQTKIANDFRKPLAEAVDAYFPWMYTPYDVSESGKWQTMAAAAIAETRRVGGYDKPIYPFMWFQYHQWAGSKALHNLEEDYWRLQIETVRELADGMIVWGGYRMRWNDKARWWRVIQPYLGQPVPLRWGD